MRPPTRRTRSAASMRAFSFGLVRCRFRRKSWDARRRTRSRAETRPRRAGRSVRRSAANVAAPARVQPRRRGSRSAARPPSSIFCNSAICVRPGQIGAGSTRGASRASRVSSARPQAARSRPGRVGPAWRRDRRAGRFPGCARDLDLRRPFGRRAEKGAIVHLLKGAAPEHARARPGR